MENALKWATTFVISFILIVFIANVLTALSTISVDKKELQEQFPIVLGELHCRKLSDGCYHCKRPYAVGNHVAKDELVCH